MKYETEKNIIITVILIIGILSGIAITLTVLDGNEILRFLPSLNERNR
jgi:hypothetical protein